MKLSQRRSTKRNSPMLRPRSGKNTKLNFSLTICLLILSLKWTISNSKWQKRWKSKMTLQMLLNLWLRRTLILCLKNALLNTIELHHSSRSSLTMTTWQRFLVKKRMLTKWTTNSVTRHHWKTWSNASRLLSSYTHELDNFLFCRLKLRELSSQAVKPQEVCKTQRLSKAKSISMSICSNNLRSPWKRFFSSPIGLISILSSSMRHLFRQMATCHFCTVNTRWMTIMASCQTHQTQTSTSTKILLSTLILCRTWIIQRIGHLNSCRHHLMPQRTTTKVKFSQLSRTNSHSWAIHMIWGSHHPLCTSANTKYWSRTGTTQLSARPSSC